MPRRAGKTSKKAPLTGKRYPLNMRTTFEMRQRLEQAAKESGRSLAAEAEDRLQQSFLDRDFLIASLEQVYGSELAGLLLVLGDAMRPAGVHAALAATGNIFSAVNEWSEYPEAYDEVAKAAMAVLEAFRPEAKNSASPNPPSAEWREFLNSPDVGRAYANDRLTRLEAEPEGASPFSFNLAKKRMLGRLLENLQGKDSREKRKSWPSFE
jgi:hypothetical protein